MRVRKSFRIPELQGDLTSMIDIVFLLLIFFILMPFKSTESTLETNLPKNSGTANTPIKEKIVEKIEIRIRNDSEKGFDTASLSGVIVTVNGKKQSTFLGIKNRLSELSASINAEKSTIPVEIKADEDVPFYFILKAVDYAKTNQFSFIKFPMMPTIKNVVR